MATVVSIRVLPAVLRITDDRVADGAEVRTDLVRLTGDEVDLQDGVIRAALQGFIRSMDFDGVLERLRADLDAVRPFVLREVAVDALCVVNVSTYDGEVVLLHRSVTEQGGERLERRQGLSEKDEAGGVPIEAVGDARLEGLELRFCEGSRRHQVLEAALVHGWKAGSIRLAEPSGRLVQHQQVFVLVDDVLSESLYVKRALLSSFRSISGRSVPIRLCVALSYG